MPTVNVPMEVPASVHGTDLEAKLLAKAGRKALEQAVLELYKDGEISAGTGAKLLDLPLYDFIQFLGQHDVAIFDYTEEELQQEFETVDKLAEELKSGKAERQEPASEQGDAE